MRLDFTASRQRLWHLGAIASGQLFVAATALVSIRAYTELLAPAEFGQTMLVQGIFTLIDSATLLALSQTLVTQCGTSTDRRSSAQLITSGFIRIFTPLVTLAAVALTATLAAITNEFAWFIATALYPVYFVTEAIKMRHQAVLVLERRYKQLSIWTSFEAVLVLLLTVLALTLWRADSVGYLVGYLSARAISTMVATRRRLISRRTSDSTDERSDLLRDSLRYGLPVAAMGPLAWVSIYIDRYILGASLSASAVGVYVAVTGLASRPYSLLSTILSNYFRPLYFQNVTPHNRPHMRVLRSWTLSALASGMFGAAIFLVAGPAISWLLLAPEYRDQATLLLATFAIAQAFSIATHAADNALLSDGRSRQLLIMQVGLSIVSIGVIPVGISVGGILGGVVARAITEALRFTIVLTVAIKTVRRGNSQDEVSPEREIEGLR